MIKNAWSKYDKNTLNEVYALCEDYKNFLSICKTERETVKEIIKRCESKGFRNLEEYINNNNLLKKGDKIYVNNNGKSVVLFIIGEKDITDGINILGAHIDSPRLDLKANTIYEEDNFAYFDTHYYGGIKKYQWVTLPLALHGVVIKKNQEKIEINIGEDPDDMVFEITDLLPHLAQKQMDKKASELIEGENLDVLIGSIPLDTKENSSVKKNILNILKEKYDIMEEDFLSAEIEVVPAGYAKDLGFDRSMITSYGQDDRICAYTSLQAFLDIKDIPKKTLSCILVDKEEIGSVGSSSMQSHFFDNAIAEITGLLGKNTDIAVRRTLKNSKMLSSDVNAAYDPLYKDVMDKRNSSFLGCGLVFCKYTGSKGKSGSNDADAEYVAELRKIMDDNNISYQLSELGKVDMGGGGTIAYILANYNVKVIDCGVGVLNMHAPWEITSKIDVYEAYRGYIAFLENA